MADMPSGPYPAWLKSPSDVQCDLHVDLAVGLSDAEVLERQKEYGFNELEKEPATPWWKLVAEQFDDMLVKVRSSIGLRHISLPSPDGARWQFKEHA
jgi:Ca2+-transporting ATPase